MKVRVKWTKTGVLKFIGHLDVQRYFQKALMRAELPVSFSKGMSPHQIMSFAAPLGLGMTSEGEYADISFDWTYSSEEMLSRINAVMNEGISVLEFKEIDEKEKNCMAVTAAADYLVTFREGYYYKDAFLKRTQPFSMQEKISIIKKTKRSEKEVDIAPMILDIREYESEPLLPGLPLKQEGIFMKLVGSRKFTWGICSIGILLAIVSVFFLPQIIPVHFANGIADDMLTTTIMAAKCPKYISPAMNTNMFENPIVQDNLKKLKDYGYEVIEPAVGYLACGTTGSGKMPEPEVLLSYIMKELAFEKDLKGKVLFRLFPFF
mgnify:CR=1 FL=1